MITPWRSGRTRARLLHLLLLAAPAAAAEPPGGFTRLVAHWANYGDPGYLRFIEDAAPEVAQVGFYGAHFWSLVHTPQFGGFPAHFPVRGLDECAGWFRDLNAELDRRGVLAVGHFNVEFLVGEPGGPGGEGARGFFQWYRDGWDEGLLGPKPVEDPLEFLEKNADGSPIVNQSYSIGGMREYWACLRNPAWQAVLKAWVRRGVALGVDGFVINYFYRHNCRCEHCEAGFRRYLRGRFPADELRRRFAIGDLAAHRFDEIVSWHPPSESTPLRREMLRFSQVSNQEAFEEVFVRHGRSLKPDLVLARWDHLGDFVAISGDERCLLPPEMWSRGETYIWYSTGGAANTTDLARGVLGEGTLQARYIRGASGDKPFTLGKYEGTRIRSAIAELAANGGAPMGFYTRFTDPEARAVIVRYYQFLRRYERLYRDNRPHCEVTLLFPRTHVHRGEVAAIDRFREAGRALLDDHVLFGVRPDDLDGAGEDGGGGGAALPVDPAGGLSTAEMLAALPAGRSRFGAPATVRVSASLPAGDGGGREIDFHFVNYNRVEPPRGPDGRPSPGGGIADEKPVAAPGVAADIALPPGARVAAVSFITPEEPDGAALEWQSERGRLRFSTPGFLVYGVARVQLD